MSRSDMLLIGCGGCGNNQLNELLNRSRRYNGLFFNTNIREMEGLDNFDIDRRCFYIPSADGTGKNRSLTEVYIKEEAPKFAETMSGFKNANMVTILSSANGGTGSKAATLFPSMIYGLIQHGMMKLKSLSLITTFPSLDESFIDFENTIDYWNEMLEAVDDDFINNVTFIDNGKYNEKEINDYLASDFNNIFDMAEGKIDNSDLDKYFQAKGYNFALRLNESITNTRDAMERAKDETIFFVPDDLQPSNERSKMACDVMIATVNINSHNPAELRSMVKGCTFQKINEVTEGDSFVIFGGCEIPTYPIDLIRDALRDMRLQKRNRKNTKLSNLKVKDVFDDIEVKSNKEKENKNVKPNIKSKDFDKIFDDDFWK